MGSGDVVAASPVTSPPTGLAGTGVSSPSCGSSCIRLARKGTCCEEEADEEAEGFEEYGVAKMLSPSESCGEGTEVVHKVSRASGAVRDRPVAARGCGSSAGSKSAVPLLRWVVEASWEGGWRRLLPDVSRRGGELLSGTSERDDIEPTLDKYLSAWLHDWAFSGCQQIAVGQRHHSVLLSSERESRAGQGWLGEKSEATGTRGRTFNSLGTWAAAAASCRKSVSGDSSVCAL